MLELPIQICHSKTNGCNLNVTQLVHTTSEVAEGPASDCELDHYIERTECQFVLWRVSEGEGGTLFQHSHVHAHTQHRQRGCPGSLTLHQFGTQSASERQSLAP